MGLSESRFKHFFEKLHADLVLHALVTVETAEKLTSGKNVWEAMGKLINQHEVLFMKSSCDTVHEINL